jgi:hypothetical protein
MVEVAPALDSGRTEHRVPTLLALILPRLTGAKAA